MTGYLYLDATGKVISLNQKVEIKGSKNIILSKISSSSHSIFAAITNIGIDITENTASPGVYNFYLFY